MAKKESNPDYFMLRTGKIIEEFQAEAAHFSYIMAKGAGLRTPSLIETIRKLEMTYMHIVSHLDAANSMNGGSGITMDDALGALEIARALAEQEEAESQAS